MERRYALDLASPVSFVATALEAAAPASASLSELSLSYRHVSSADYSRIKIHEGCATDVEAKRWLIQAAVAELGKHVLTATEDDGSGERYTLISEFDKIRVNRHKIHRWRAADPETDRERETRAAYIAIRENYPCTVQVQGMRGGVKERRLEVHPLAQILPLMTEAEFAELVADIDQHGIRDPLYLFDGKLLDGRHRAGVAAMLDWPVEVVAFTGTEDEARHFVISKNLRRRHLTSPQRAQLVRELFLAEAQTEAAERYRETVGRPPKSAEESTAEPAVDSDAETRPKPRGKTAAQVAAERSGGLSTARNVESLAPLDDAPMTKERVRSGEITSITEARRAALVETGRVTVEPDKLPPLDLGSWGSLGRARHEMERANKALRASGLGVQHHSRTTPRTRDEHLKRLAEIRNLCNEYEAGLESAE